MNLLLKKGKVELVQMKLQKRSLVGQILVQQSELYCGASLKSIPIRSSLEEHPRQ